LKDRDAAAYEEVRCALTKPFLGWCLFTPVAAEIVFLLLAATWNIQWLIAAAAVPLFAPVMIAISFLYRNWPTGIRIDETGITVGAIRSRRAASRQPTVYHQSWGRYHCPWSSVNDARLVTDPVRIRLLAKAPDHYTLNNSWAGRRGLRQCDIGVLTSPFMRAALVVDLYPSGVTGTVVRPGRVYTNFSDGHFSHRVAPRIWDTWIVPTRNPERLEAALRRYRPG
jgi:hypothetical protein